MPGPKSHALREITRELLRSADGVKAKTLSSFFKTQPGGYAQHDQFLGISVPQLRRLAYRHDQLTFTELGHLLHSPIHEERLFALLAVVHRFDRSHTDKQQQQVYRFYLHHFPCINNWDLVDLTAGKIVGRYLDDKAKAPLYRWAKDPNFWIRRIAIVATYPYIKRQHFQTTLDLAKILLHDPEDLIQKAVGWMLREIGKQDKEAEAAFLNRYYQSMPRTMLRYALEHFPVQQRLRYLKPIKKTGHL